MDDIINTNLRSVFLGSREAAKYMRHNKEGGSIVNIALQGPSCPNQIQKLMLFQKVELL